MKPYERIIRSRGDLPAQEKGQLPPDSGDSYEAFSQTQGFPQMGFSLFLRKGERHVFFYHNLDNLDLIEKDKYQYVRFTHRGKAVTMRGLDLHGMIEAMLAHTLQAIYEYDEAVYSPIQRGEQIIDRVLLTTLPGSVPAASVEAAFGDEEPSPRGEA